jgi:hypothetical protein
VINDSAQLMAEDHMTQADPMAAGSSVGGTADALPRGSKSVVAIKG